MKIYFFTETESSVMDFAFPEDEPKNAIASFTLTEGQSTLELRYKLVNGALVDLHPGKTDAEVIAIIQQAEAKAAEDLAKQLAETPAQ
jgi:hypothetical protein